jgi:hypothetical protein
MKVLAIGSGNPAIPFTLELKQKYMPNEVPATLKLYLDGKIEQYWFRLDKDNPGVIFLMDVESVNEANTLIDAMPLASAKIINFELMPIGPLMPLGMLIQPQ